MCTLVSSVVSFVDVVVVTAVLYDEYFFACAKVARTIVRLVCLAGF